MEFCLDRRRNGGIRRRKVGISTMKAGVGGRNIRVGLGRSKVRLGSASARGRWVSVGGIRRSVLEEEGQSSETSEGRSVLVDPRLPTE